MKEECVCEHKEAKEPWFFPLFSMIMVSCPLYMRAHILRIVHMNMLQHITLPIVHVYATIKI